MQSHWKINGIFLDDYCIRFEVTHAPEYWHEIEKECALFWKAAHTDWHDAVSTSLDANTLRLTKVCCRQLFKIQCTRATAEIAGRSHQCCQKNDLVTDLSLKILTQQNKRFAENSGARNLNKLNSMITSEFNQTLIRLFLLIILPRSVPTPIHHLPLHH